MAPRSLPDAPRLNLREALSPDVVQQNLSADVPNLAGLGRASAALGGELDDIAARAAQTAGAEQAAADIAAGRGVTAKAAGLLGFSVKAESYNKVADAWLATQHKADLSQAMGEAFAANPDNPVKLEEAFGGVLKSVRPTGRAMVDAEVQGTFLTQRADFLARAAAGAKKAAEERGAAAFLQDLQDGEVNIGRVASGAPIDAQGGQRVSDAIRAMVQTLSKYGPKTPFKVGGIEFAASEDRMDALSPARMEPLIQQAVGQATSAWVLTQADRLPTEAAKREFAQQIRTRWEAGDPLFKVIDGGQMVTLQRQLEADGDRARASERAASIEAGQDVRQGIEAFRWGGDVNFDQLARRAAQSGDAGLVAEVDFYRKADPETRGVLHTVYARQLGLIGGGGDGAPVVVDAQGRPVPRGIRNNNPGNLEDGDFAKSLPGYAGSDGRFARFATPEAGVSAAQANLRGYFQKGFDTVAEVVGRWAPAKDGNDVKGYTARVAAALKVDPNAKLTEADIPRLANAMFGVESPGGAWDTPAGVKPGTPAYVAWAATREGFTSDPLKYALGGENRPAIAPVSVLVPEAAFAQGDAHQAWSTSLQERAKLGRSLASIYGVAPRILTNQERDFYKARVEADPQQAVALAIVAKDALGAGDALAFMRELGDTPGQASAHLHIADLAVTSPGFAKAAAQGIAYMAEGAKLPDDKARDIRVAFEDARHGVPGDLSIAAERVAMAAALNDFRSGADRPASYYLKGALGGTARDGHMFGGPATVNGALTVVPRWLNPQYADDALEAVGTSWAAQGIGPVWANGEPVSGREMARMRMQLTPNGTYRLINPKTGNPLRNRQGRPMEIDFDRLRTFVATSLGPKAARGGD